jgi:predicted RecB family nuclease
VQGRAPASGTLILLGDRSSRVKLTAEYYKEVRQIVETLRNWAETPAAYAPPVVLNKHCPSCPFRDACLAQAEKKDNLLDRMTPKLVRKYHDKGIFAVRQLSHIYKPRRSRKRCKRPVRHSLELQALAIRTAKIHVEYLPELPLAGRAVPGFRGEPRSRLVLPGRASRVPWWQGRIRVLLGGRREG